MVALIQATLAFSLAFALIAVLSRWLSRAVGVRWWYWVWLLLALRLLIPFCAEWPQAPLVLDVAEVQRQTTLAPSETLAPAASPVPVAPQQGNWLRWAVPVYLAGAGLFAGYFMLNSLLFRRKLRRWSRPAQWAQTIQAFEAEKARLGIRRPVRLLVCPPLSGPALQGLFRPTVLLPSEAVDGSDLSFAFAHELAHLKHHDLWYKRLLLIVQGLHWFNPLVHVMAFLARNDLELACDSRIVERQDAHFRARYGYALLQIARSSRSPISSLGMGSGKQALKRRLGHLFDGKPRREGLAVVASVAAVLLFSGALLGQASALAAPHYANPEEYASSYFDPSNDGFYLLSASGHPSPAVVETSVVVYLDETEVPHQPASSGTLEENGPLPSIPALPDDVAASFMTATGLPLMPADAALSGYDIPALCMKPQASVLLLPSGDSATDGWWLQAGDTVSITLNMSENVPLVLGYRLQDGSGNWGMLYSGPVFSGVCTFTVPEDGSYSFLMANPAGQAATLQSGLIQLKGEPVYFTTTIAVQSFPDTTVMDDRPME